MTGEIGSVDLGWEDDRLRDECGVVIIYLHTPDPPEELAASAQYRALRAINQMENRGKDSAGIGGFDAETKRPYIVKGLGTVALAMETNDKGESLRLVDFPSTHIALGSTRWGTMEKVPPARRIKAAMPQEGFNRKQPFALAANGDAANDVEISELHGYHRNMFVSDVEMITQLVNDEVAFGLAPTDALVKIMKELQGGYTIGLMSEDMVVGVRDPKGIRPLLLGEIPDKGWVMASETPALDAAGAQFVRDVEAGEMIIITKGELMSVHPFSPETVDEKLCAFEFIYFAREESTLNGQNVEASRINMGELVADVLPVEADYVFGIPKSGLPAAAGYSARSGIKIGQAIGLNPAAPGSIFMVQGQKVRESKITDKYSLNRHYIEGKRLVGVDDSVVRGTTHKPLVKWLFDAGAAEVHLRLAGPLMLNPCFMGTATRNRNELIAYQAWQSLAKEFSPDEITDTMIVEWIRADIGATSLAYNSVENLRRAVGPAGDRLDLACMTGDYPIEVPDRLKKEYDLGRLVTITSRAYAIQP